jgi:hypothetical protein
MDTLLWMIRRDAIWAHFLARFLLTGLAVTQGLIALKIDCLLPPA